MATQDSIRNQDHYETPDGPKPVKASPEELREREVAALYRELGFVNDRIANIAAMLQPFELALGPDYEARQREGWQRVAETIHGKLEALGEKPERNTKK